MKIFSTSRMLVALGLLMAVSFSCSDDDDKNDPTPTPTNDVQLKDNATLGKILTDSKGRTLYYFSKDASGASACSGNCLINWPIYSAGDLTAIKLDAGLDKADFGTITTDGKPQTTYKGWPLYYYKDDVVAGDVKGDNSNSVWFVVKTDYTIMIASGQLVGNDGKSYKSDYTEGTGATQFFTDGKGRTLYAFVNDKNNKNNFTKADFSNDGVWPIYTADLKSLPTGVDKTLFSTIDVFGKKQLTYKGWPLYYFGLDGTTRGATKGVSVPKPGIWPIVNTASPTAPN